VHNFEWASDDPLSEFAYNRYDVFLDQASVGPIGRRPMIEERANGATSITLEME
jgi:hypothetical protein